MNITISEEQKGKRLDIFLAEQLPEHSRSAWQKKIQAGTLVVNRKKHTPHYRVKRGDVISFIEKPQEKKMPEEFFTPLEIIEETSEYFVIKKSTGLTVHPAAQHTGTTLVDALLKHSPALRLIGDDPARPGIVHRLDKDASGVMVIARTQESFESLKRQFKLRTVRKEYQIFVHGIVTPVQGVIELGIQRSKQRFTKFAASATGARAARTEYWVERSCGKYSLVRAQPTSGRTHQIRVHFFARGYPIVGDRIYRSKKNKELPEVRLMLHASLLEFADLSGVRHTYRCPPPKDFQDIVQKFC